MIIMNMVEALNSALKNEMEKDDKVIILGEDVGIDGGVFRVTEGLYKKFGNLRVIDTPLAESGIVGTSIGLAINGFKPVAEIQFEGFSFPALDQIVNHASRIRNRSRGRFTCPLVVRFPYCGGIRALEHHSDSPEAYYVHTPGLKVVIPSNPYDAKGLLISSIRDPDPVIFMEPKRLYRSVKQKVPEEEYSIELGKGNLIKEGNEITLISYGAMVRECVNAAEQSKINCDIIDLRTLKPLDTDLILKSVEKTGRVIIVHEAPRTSGFGAEIAALIQEKALLSLKAPVKRVTGFDVVFPYFKLENDYLPNVKRIVNAMDEVMNF